MTSSTRVLCALLLGAHLLATRAQAQPAAPTTSSNLRVQIEGEQPSGVYLDRDTLQTQTALVWTISAVNETPQTRRVSLTWRIESVEGQTFLTRDDSVDLPPGGSVRRRELFLPPRRGAFVISAHAVAKKAGADDEARFQVPFAVVAAPVESYRPNSFFALTTPLLLSDQQLDFYELIGARVLRSPLLAGGDYTGAALDAQLRARLGRQLATQAVVDLPAPSPSSPFARPERWRELLARYPGVTAWEVSGLGASAAYAALSEAARATPNVSALRPFGAGAIAARDRFSLAWPEAPNALLHPSAALRFLLARRALASNQGVGMRVFRDDVPDSRRAAAFLVQDALLSISSGASGLSEPLEPPDATQPTIAGMARGAAFSTMTRLLEAATFEEDVFPASPLVYGQAFQTPGGTVVALWQASGHGGARLAARLADASLMDAFGNTVDRARRNRILIPLGAQPVYLLSSLPPAEVARALRAGTLTDLRPLEAQLLPLTQAPPPIPPAPKKGEPPVAPRLVGVRVRLQNVGIAPLSGTLRLARLLAAPLPFQLNAGESRIYKFAVAPRQPLLRDERFGAEIEARTNKGNFQWDQTTRLATMDEARRDMPVTIDGDLNEWRDAAWMELAPPDKAIGPRARLALRFDARRLYIAARVEEASLQPRTPGGDYAFWRGHDAIQFAFGLRDDEASKPTRGPFRDTDYGFLLSPFSVAGDGSIEGRLLSLWNPSLPFDGARDQVRYGGPVAGSDCIVRRDPSGRFTVYEASLPLSFMPRLLPSRRAVGNTPVRFSWILHSDESAPLEWGRATNVFPWQRNPTSFLPSQIAWLPAQTIIGFTPHQGVTGSIVVAPIPVSTPRPTPRPGPAVNLPPLPAPPLPAPATPRATPLRPIPRPAPHRVSPPVLAPMPPNSLPPGASSAPQGQPLPPALELR